MALLFHRQVPQQLLRNRLMTNPSEYLLIPLTNISATMPNMNRLYLDLIYKGSDYYAHYYPSSGPLKPGDYGIVTRDGSFLRHENIYSTKFKESFDPDGKVLAPIKQDSEDCIKIYSAHVKSLQAKVKTCVVNSTK